LTLKMVAPDLSSKELGKRTEWPKKGVNLGSKNLSNNILNLCKYTSPTYAIVLKTTKSTNES